MGIWQTLFGSKPAALPATPPKPMPIEDVIARIQAGTKVELHVAFAGTNDEEEESGLWALLPHTAGALRVEVIERLTEFELDADQQARLVCAAVDKVPGAGFTAAAIASACDLTAVSASAAARQPVDGAVLDAIGMIVAALCEAALGQGPAEEEFDVGGCAATVRAWSRIVAAAGAGPADLVALDLALQVCVAEDLGEEEIEAGWDEDLEEALRSVLAKALEHAPRGGGTWHDRLVAGLNAEAPDVALQALIAARIADIPMQDAVLDRVREQPQDDGAWSLALQLLDFKMLDVLAPLAGEQLRHRRTIEAGLCSPASQACCGSCGGGDKAQDDDLMVPKALEARVLPLLGLCTRTSGKHTDLLAECLEAPSPNLRFAATAVLSQWPQDALTAELWTRVEALKEDSHPQVQANVLDLLQRKRLS